MDRSQEPAAPTRQLSLFDSASIIVGIIVGAGIYETSPQIAGLVGGPGSLVLVWAVGGMIALVGAMSYAELATTYPSDGGDYVYLTRAFGRQVGFLFAWAEYWIIRPGNVGMMAFVFARFAHDLAPLRPTSAANRFDYVVYAGGAIIILTALNLLGVRAGKTTQNLLTIAKVVGLLIIFILGVFFGSGGETIAAPSVDAGSTNFQLALIFVLFTYGGWNEMSYVAAEVRNPERNISRALILGTLVVTITYVAVNLAFLRALGLQGTAESQAVAADVLRLQFGPSAGRIMSSLVCVSCLGAINGLLFTGSRVFYAAGKDHRVIHWLGRWSRKFDSPIQALLLQLAVTLALIGAFGSEDGFQQLLRFTTPVYWFFASGVAVSLFVLRWRDPKVDRPHRVIGYPLTPLLFLASCLFMFYSSADYAYAAEELSSGAFWTIGILIAGAAVSVASMRK